MDIIGDAQFRVMSQMWSVDEAIKAAKRMKLGVTQAQIDAARKAEQETNKRWDDVFRRTTKEG